MSNKKKTLILITNSKDMGLWHKDQIMDTFDSEIRVDCYSLEENTAYTCNYNNCHAILISTFRQYELLKSLIPDNKPIIISSLTIAKKGLEVLDRLRNQTVMFVNLSFEMCLETILLFYRLGYSDIRFLPFYPELQTPPKSKIAVTTGELRFVPKNVDQIYDIGKRILDRKTISRVANVFYLQDRLNTDKCKKSFSNMAKIDSDWDFIFESSELINSRLESLINIIDKAVILLDSEENIISINGRFEEISKKERSLLIGKPFSAYFPETDLSKAPIKNKLCKLDGEYLSVSVSKIEGREESLSGYYAIVENFEKNEDQQTKLKSQFQKKGHIAKYGINDILGNSDKIKNTIDLIHRFAPSDSPVLITGDSGTGKELVANALHKLSKRKTKQFLALNCAALSPDLIESELFGYEKGAFTGALKTGKPGIFEMANGGTLFLDEIGELSLGMQAKLLRVLQEKEVMRVGGEKIVQVNIRFIFASNKNLAKKTVDGNFRRDLYYRMAVLTIHVPPLSERISDIEGFIEKFMDNKKTKVNFSKELITFFKSYTWPGNIRELKNTIEYLQTLGKKNPSISDLPRHMMTIKEISPSVSTYSESIDSKFNSPSEISFYSREKNLEKAIEKMLAEAKKMGLKPGRTEIRRRLSDIGIEAGDYEIRKILKKLKDR